MAAITEVMDPKVIMDGDIVLLHCPDTSGVVYSKPFGSKEPDFLTIESTEKNGFILELATFCITQRKQSNCQNKIEDSSQLMEIVYGSTIKLQHQVSGKYLTVGNDNKLTLCLEDSDDESGDKNLFKIIPPHQEKGWGESLKISDSIKFESVRGGKIKFQHKPEENCYRPSIETDGTMFFIEFYCQRHATLNPNCIKGGSIVMLASTGIDGYLAAKGSFVSKKLQELKSTHDKDGSKSTCDTDDSKSTCGDKDVNVVGLRRWRKGFFNIAPFSGDTFFQLENIRSKTNKGSQLSFNTGCRIKHLLTQQYISVENQSFKLNVDKNSKYVHFKILPSDVDAKLVASDHIILQHVKTGEYLSFNVTLDDHDNQWSNLVLAKEEIPFKVLQVDKLAIQDAYQIMGISSALCESFDKIIDVHVTPDVLKSQLKIVINIMKQLQASFHLLCCKNKNSSCHIKTNNKTRQANMLRTFQMIDLMITLLEEMTKISADTLIQEACSSICSSLQMYVEYGSFKSILYLAQNQPLLKIIGNMVGKCSSADKVLITLFNKHREMSHKELIFDLIQNLNLKNSEVFGLMFTLSFNGRWINWKIYEKINERLIPENEEMLSDNVREFLKDFEKERENMERTMTATNVLCSTCVFMKPEEEIGSQVPYNDQSSQRCVQCIQAIQSALPNERACSLLVQLMNVLVFLFDYGAIKISKDVADIIMKLLRDEDTETCNQCVTTVSLKIKKLALLSLKLLLKRNFHAAIEALLNDFNALRKETGDANEMASWDSSNIELTSIGIQLPNNNGNPPHEIMKVLLDHSLEVKKEHWGQVIKESQARLRHNFNCNQGYSILDIATDEGQELCHILIELVDNNNDADIQLMSTELLYDIYSVEETVLSEAAERTYFMYSKEEVKIHREMKELATMTDKEQLLYKMLRREIDESAADDLQKLLEKMTKACISEDDETKPNSISQNVAYSCGLFNVILEHVLEHKDSSDLQNHEIIILTKCFTLLQKLSRKNEKVQNKLFTSFHDFLQTKRKDMIRPVICLLNEVFFRNFVLCERLTETDIDNIFSTAIISKDPEHHQLIVTMTIIINTFMLPQSTNPALPMQEYVARLILRHSTSTLKSLLGKEMKSERKNILSNESDDNQELRLLLNVTHLLASCCTRECQVAESAAAQIYSIDELLNIITDDTIAIRQKFPFIRILTWTYLITEMDSAVACSTLISTNNFWEFLESFNENIDDLVASASSDEEKTRLKFLEKSDLTIHILTMDRNSPSDKINKNLIYIIEGIIPLLSGLCQELSCHLYAGTIPHMTSKSIEVIRMLGDKLKVIYKLEVCSVLEQMEEMMCMKKINSLCKFYERDLIEETEQLQVTNDSVPEETDEDNLNNQFQTFIKNYNNAYNNSPVKGDMKNVPIPKGHSFEKLLEVFDDEDYTKKKIESLKVYKLILVLRTLIERQKVLGLHCFERTNLEKMTLTTLQLLYGLVYKRIVTIKSKRDSLKPAEFQKQYKKVVQPIQAILLHEEVDCIQTLFELLHHPNNDITYQVLACLDVLLYPGNEEAQRKVTSIYEQDQSLLVCVQKILKLKCDQTSLDKSKTLKLTSEEPATGQASTSFMSEPKKTLPPEVEEKRITFVNNQTTMALDVLVWLCDGQQKIMQDALRTQSTFSGSNIVSQVSFLLLGIIEGIAENLKETDIIIAQKAFQALIEMCAGNYNNQCIAFRGQVIVSINAVLQKESSDTQVRAGFSELKSSSLELLEVMLEKIDEKSSTLAGWIVKQLEIQNLLKGMLHSWQCYSKAAPTYNAVKRIFVSEATSPARNSLFRAYHVLRRISNYQKISVDELVERMLRSNSGKSWSSKEAKESATEFDKLLKDNVIEAKKMWQHCKKWSRAVEISYKPNHDTEILTQAYFPYNPHTHLSEEHKSTILLNIKRNTPQEKLFDLLKWTDKVKSMKERKDNLKRYGIFHFSTIRHYMLYFLTIILNLMILFSLRFPTNNNYNGQACSAAFNDTCNSSSPMYFQPILSPDVPAWYIPVHYTLGSIHLILALWMVIQYFIRNERKDVRFLPYSVQMFIYKANKGLLRRKHLYQFISKLNDVLCRGKISADKPEPIAYFQIVFFSFQSFYRILFVLFSVAGLATKGYFYCGCILYPFLNNKVMSFIIRALRKSAFQLLTVLTLCFVCTYIYAVVSFALLQNYFSEAKDEFCNTLLECFITVSRLGLLNTLGSGLSIRPSDEYEPNFQLLLARTVYDIIFFVVVTTLGLNIVIAILVDRFSEMREETDKVDDDNKTRCLVCSITKDELERQGQSSKKHINEDHNVWNYIKFVMYLDTIHKNDYNALEKYVSHQVESGSIDFFPLKTDSVM